MLLSIKDVLELQISVVRPRLKIGSSKMSAKKFDRQKLEDTKIRFVRPGAGCLGLPSFTPFSELAPECWSDEGRQNIYRFRLYTVSAFEKDVTRA